MEQRESVGTWCKDREIEMEAEVKSRRETELKVEGWEKRKR